MKKTLLLLLLCFTGLQTVLAQACAYKVLHSVQNEMKIEGNCRGTVFYFTFNNNKSKCYLTGKDGIYRQQYGIHEYDFIGTQNRMHIYKMRGTILSGHDDMLYFSLDFKRLNWECCIDNIDANGNTIFRVLEYVENPETKNIPKSLY